MLTTGILICCTGQFWSGSLCLFGFCLQVSSVSNFLPDTSGREGGGLLFRFACSVLLWGAKSTSDKYHWRVWGALAVFQPHWVCPSSWHVCFPCLHCSGSRLLYRERALSCVHFPGPRHSGSGFRVLHKGSDSVGPAFCAFPSGAAQGMRSLTSVLSPGAAWLLPSLSQPQFPSALVQCTLYLFWGADLWLRPSRQMSTIQNLRKSLVRNWKPVYSLVGDALSGAQFAPFPSPLPPASSGGWAGPQPASSSLEFLSPSLFWKWAGSAFG